ncbi:hypothetical protein JCM10207_001996 [Rhodosporidiobolus poonsookiae]
MRRGQRHNAITNSPIVRSFIKPVLHSIPPSQPSTSSSQPATARGNPYLAHEIDEQDTGAAEAAAQPSDGNDDAQWLIPTQPLSVATSGSDVKGKKRARDEDEEQHGDALAGAAEYDQAAGTRFGVPVRYSEENLPEELAKYWAQRYRLFSLFDEGCEMDREGWYSVTPENIAAQIAERCRCGVIVDAFCGVGGNAIQFAFTCERVIALDTSPVRLACARRNAEVYGVADRITFILADWVQWTQDYVAREQRGEVKPEDKVEVVFLSPPWGGIDYQTAGAGVAPPAKKARHSLLSSSAPVPSTPTPSVPLPSPAAEPASPPPAYPLSALAPQHGRSLFALARRVTPNIAYYLPRNVDLLEVAALPRAASWADRPGAGEGKEERVEVEEEWMGYKLKAVTAYFGELAVGAGWVQEEGEGKSE